MYVSSCDGRANSKNRYKTNAISSVEIIQSNGRKKSVNEFLHNDFEPCFESYDVALEYCSKIERAWNAKTFMQDPEWDQVRRLETWNGRDWDCAPGKKWGYFKLERYKRTVKKKITSKSLDNIVARYFETMSDEEIIDKLDDIESLKEEISRENSLSASESSKLAEIDIIEMESNRFVMSKYEEIEDIDMNVDSERYLGKKRNEMKMEEVLEILNKQKPSKDDLVDFFSGNITSDIYDPVRIMDYFYVYQGTQFSKEDAYNHPGEVPVYTAATDGPAYFADKNIPGKTMLKGKTLIWSRKGAKAGTLQIINNNICFYISDVSGTIMPKDKSLEYDLTFLKYYIEGQLKRERQSVSNNAQLNKSKVENLNIYLPDNQKEIGDFIRKIKR